MPEVTTQAARVSKESGVVVFSSYYKTLITEQKKRAFQDGTYSIILKLESKNLSHVAYFKQGKVVQERLAKRKINSNPARVSGSG